MVAKTVSTAVLDTFNEMDDSKLNILKHYLSNTKTTVVCELLQPHYQHIIDLSHLKKSTIHGLMMTSVPGKEEDNSLTTIPPHVCLEYFKFFGISIPEYYLIPANAVKENIMKVGLHVTCLLYIYMFTFFVPLIGNIFFDNFI